MESIAKKRINDQDSDHFRPTVEQIGKPISEFAYDPFLLAIKHTDKNVASRAHDPFLASPEENAG